MFLRYALVTVWVLCGQSHARSQEVGNESEKVDRIVSKVIDNASGMDRYCIFGKITTPNLRANSIDEPLSCISDFVIISDAQKKFRRQSFLREGLDSNGQLKIFKWASRISSKGKVYSGPEELGLSIVKDRVAATLPDFEPFELPIASSFDFKNGKCVPGYFMLKCDPGKALEIESTPQGDVITFEVNAKTRAEVYFAKKFGGMPAKVSWRVSDAASKIPLKNGKDTFSVLVCESVTNWSKLGSLWLPVRTVIERCNSLVGGERRVIESIDIDFRWVRDEKIFDPAVAESRAEELVAAIKKSKTYPLTVKN